MYYDLKHLSCSTLIKKIHCHSCVKNLIINIIILVWYDYRNDFMIKKILPIQAVFFKLFNAHNSYELRPFSRILLFRLKSYRSFLTRRNKILFFVLMVRKVFSKKLLKFNKQLKWSNLCWSAMLRMNL